MKTIKIGLVFLMCSVMSCHAQRTDQQIDQNKLLERVKVLSSDTFEGRKTGKKGSDTTRAYIIQQFKDLKIPGYKNNYEQSFSFSSWGGSYKGVNVLAEIKGTASPDKYIIITAHHDHLGIINEIVHNGADDNASGVSALISFAEYFSKNPPKHSVLFIATDAEELGLNGAKYFVKTFDMSKAMVNINMDMISRSPRNELYVVGARYNNTLKTILAEFNNPTTTHLIQGHDGTDGKEDWTISSDHGPFHLAQIPFLYFGNEDHKAYHRPSDDFTNITPEFYKNSVSIILTILQAIDASGID